MSENNLLKSATWSYWTAVLWIAARNETILTEYAAFLRDAPKVDNEGVERWMEKRHPERDTWVKGAQKRSWISSPTEAEEELKAALRTSLVVAEGLRDDEKTYAAIDAETWWSVFTFGTEASDRTGGRVARDCLVDVNDKPAGRSVRLSAADVRAVWPPKQARAVSAFRADLWDVGQVLYYARTKSEVGFPARGSFRTPSPAARSRATEHKPWTVIDELLRAGRLEAVQPGDLDSIPKASWDRNSVADTVGVIFDREKVLACFDDQERRRFPEAKIRRYAAEAEKELLKAGEKLSGHKIAKMIAKHLVEDYPERISYLQKLRRPEPKDGWFFSSVRKLLDEYGLKYNGIGGRPQKLVSKDGFVGIEGK